MKQIEFERWEPDAENPRRLTYAGQRTAEDVFHELEAQLDSVGYLPDEYFSMDWRWEHGRQIPKGADFFCKTDYGGSEGIYLDVYLEWQEGDKPKRECFITGKTLGESGADLDRMFLISSAITKAFRGDNSVHARYMVVGEQSEPAETMSLNLSPDEQRLVTQALAEQRIRLGPQAEGRLPACACGSGGAWPQDGQAVPRRPLAAWREAPARGGRRIARRSRMSPLWRAGGQEPVLARARDAKFRRARPSGVP